MAGEQQLKKSSKETRYLVRILPDKTEAYLSIYPKDLIPFAISAIDLKNKLKDYGVQYGVKFPVLQEMAKHLGMSGDPIENVLIASGVSPVDGQNARIELVVNMTPQSIGKEKEDGTIDYKQKESFVKVKKGQILAYYHAPTEGLHGMGVDGNPIKAKPGKDVELKLENVNFFPEERVYKAMDDGQFLFKKNSLSVHTVMEIAGDIDFSSGCVNFPGTVTIQGSILPDFYVKARGDVFIQGIVTDGVVESGANVKVKEGIAGSGKSIVTCDGTLHTGYIQNSRVICGESVYVKKVIYSSTVFCEEKVFVEGMVLGSTITAGLEITVKDVGTEVGVHTNLEVGVQPYTKQQIKDLSERIEFCKQNIKKIEASLGEYICNMPRDVIENVYEEKSYELLRVLDMRNDLFKEKEMLEAQKEELVNKSLVTIPAYIRIRGTAHPGTKISISGKKFIVENTVKYAKFYYDPQDGIIKWSSL